MGQHTRPRRFSIRANDVSNLPQATSSWGKIVGGMLGFCMGGPWGAAVGLLVGHMHDQQPAGAPALGWQDHFDSYNVFAATTEQATFTMGVIVLSAKMAKADGRVTRAEIEAFKRVFQISPQQESKIGMLFDRARLSADGFEPFAFQLAHVFRRKRAVLEQILSGLFIIAAADSAILSPAETQFLQRISFIFGFASEDFARIAASSGARMGGAQKPCDSVNENYVILGVASNASNDQIKIAYRALIREHHPDRLMADGMPPEFVAAATEKMKRINAAYDEICKLKGIK